MSENISEKQFKKMTETPIPKLVTTMAIPTTISTLITVVYNTADTYFVSQINESAAAAVGVVYSIMAIIQAVGYGIAVGAGSLISRRLGEKKDDDANLFATSGFFASVIVGLLVAAICLPFLRIILKAIGSSDTMLPYAVPYAKIILLGAPVSCSSFVLTHILRSEGNTKLAMWGTLFGGIFNVILDPVLIFACNMGCGGAALATIISQALTFIILLTEFLRGKTILKLKVSCISKNIRDYLLIFSTGIPTIFRQGLGSLSATLLNISAVVYGDAAVAAITIANKVYVLVRNLIIGLGQGFQPVAGYNYGAGYKKRAFGAFKFASVFGTIICTVSGVIVSVFAKDIMVWFNDSPEVIKIGTETILIGCAVMPFMAFSTFLNQLYQCLGFRTIATLLATCRQGIFFIPAILISPRFLGCFGVEITQPIADLLTFFISIPFAIRFYNKEIKHAFQ